jgi:hypothetical protein
MSQGQSKSPEQYFFQIEPTVQVPLWHVAPATHSLATHAPPTGVRSAQTLFEHTASRTHSTELLLMSVVHAAPSGLRIAHRPSAQLLPCIGSQMHPALFSKSQTRSIGVAPYVSQISPGSTVICTLQDGVEILPPSERTMVDVPQWDGPRRRLGTPRRKPAGGEAR